MNRSSRFQFSHLSLSSVALLTVCLMAGFTGHAQAQSTSVRGQIAELSQRFNELEQNYNLLQLQISNLTAENNRLKQELAALKASSSSEVEEVLNAKIEAHRKSTENYVKTQFERIMSILPGERSSPATTSEGTTPPAPAQITQPTTTQRAQMTFSNDFPKNGEIYVVKSGDTLSKIAAQFGSTVRHIQNANKIEDPNTVRVGQKLFVPVER